MPWEIRGLDPTVEAHAWVRTLCDKLEAAGVPRPRAIVNVEPDRPAEEPDCLVYKVDEDAEDETLAEALEKLPTREELKAAEAFAAAQVPLPLVVDIAASKG